MQTEVEFRAFIKNAVAEPAAPILFLAGAGVSIGSGLPSFWTFSTHVIRCATGYLEQDGVAARHSVLSQNEITLLADRLRPEVLLQVLSEELDARLFEFYEWLDCNIPNPNHEFLARAIQAGHAVFTTNIDCLIEAAYRNLFNEELRVCVTEDDYAEFLRQEQPIDGEHLFQPGWLLKLHGSLGLRANKAERYATIQFALNQVGQGLTPNKAKALQQCFQTTDSCFLGYSGCDHFSVQPILRNTPSRRSVYWLWFDKDQTSPRWETDTQTFVQMQQEIEEKIAKGESYSKIAQGRGWEKLSVAEILSG
ncbi:MAG: SIR2 family protein, partial [Patescibacteria group bacterium]